jgi:hypothetical protein
VNRAEAGQPGWPHAAGRHLLDSGDERSPFPYAATGAEPILAATRQWLERAVIGLNLCPFAKSVFVKKQVRYALTAAATADELLAELEQELALLAATEAEQLDTTLLIHPLAMTDFLDYHFFLAEAEALIRNNGYDGLFQIAGLHPQYEFAGSDPDDVANYTNRAPTRCCTCCAKAASTARWPPFPTPPRFSSAISKRWKARPRRLEKLWLG